jgi:hypothetical protein
LLFIEKNKPNGSVNLPLVPFSINGILLGRTEKNLDWWKIN